MVASIKNGNVDEPDLHSSDLNAKRMDDVEVVLEYIRDRWDRDTWHDIVPGDLKPQFSKNRPQSWPKAIIQGLGKPAKYDCDYVWHKLRAAVNDRREKVGKSGQRIRGLIIADIEVVVAAVRAEEETQAKNTSSPRDTRGGTTTSIWASPVSWRTSLICSVNNNLL